MIFQFLDLASVAGELIRMTAFEEPGVRGPLPASNFLHTLRHHGSVGLGCGGRRPLDHLPTGRRPPDPCDRCGQPICLRLFHGGKEGSVSPTLVLRPACHPLPHRPLGDARPRRCVLAGHTASYRINNDLLGLGGELVRGAIAPALLLFLWWHPSLRLLAIGSVRDFTTPQVLPLSLPALVACVIRQRCTASGLPHSKSGSKRQGNASGPGNHSPARVVIRSA